MKENKKINKQQIISLCAKVVIVTFALVLGNNTVFATDDPLTVIGNLSDFIFGVIRAIGLILLGWGIVQIGLALKSHDPSQRANGFLTLARRSNYNICKRNIERKRKCADKRN